MFGACVCRDLMNATGWLVEDLAGTVGLLRGALELKANLTFKNVADDEAGVTVGPGVSACRIIYFGYSDRPVIERDWR
jgi:hypothetical protein